MNDNFKADVLHLVSKMQTQFLKRERQKRQEDRNAMRRLCYLLESNIDSYDKYIKSHDKLVNEISELNKRLDHTVDRIFDLRTQVLNLENQVLNIKRKFDPYSKTSEFHKNNKAWWKEGI